MAILILLIVALLLGTWALRPLKLVDGVEGFCYRIYVGLSLSAILILVLAVTFSIHTAQLVIDFIAAVGLGVELFVYSKRATETSRERAGARVGPMEIVCAIVVAAVLVMAVSNRPSPPGMHEFGGDVFTERSPEEVAVLAIFSHLEFLFSLSSCAAIFALACRIENRKAGWFAAAILASSPVFLWGTLDSGLVHFTFLDYGIKFGSVDLPYCGMMLSALAALAGFQDETDARRRFSWLLLAAFLTGASCGNRPTDFLIGFLFLIGVVAIAKRNRFRCAAWFAVVAVIAAMPRLLFSMPYPLWLEPNRGCAHFVTYIWDIVMRPQRNGLNWATSPGGLVLFLGIPGIIVGGKRARQLALFAVAGMVIIYCFESFPEAILPFFAAMMVVAAIAATRLERLRPLVYAVLVASFIFGLVLDAANLYAKMK